MKNLTTEQVEALTRAFRAWAKAAKRPWVLARRRRYFLVYLALRWTGARIGEATALSAADVDVVNSELHLLTLKQRPRAKSGERPSRLSAVHQEIIREYQAFARDYPEWEGDAFSVDPANFRKRFKACCRAAGIPAELAHPHVLRHTHVIELLRKGVPMTVAQDRVGHARLETTRIYAQFCGSEGREILRAKGII